MKTHSFTVITKEDVDKIVAKKFLYTLEQIDKLREEMLIIKERLQTHGVEY